MSIPDQTQFHSRFTLFNAIVHNLAEGVCLVRVEDAVLVYANPKFERMFGYDPGELVGKPATILNAWENGKSPQDVAQSIIAQLEKTGEAPYEILNQKKDGTTFWCRAHTSTIEHGEFGTVRIAVHQDIDEQKKIEETLRKSEEKFRSIFENSMEAVFFTAPDGRVFSANPAACAMTGYSEEELIRLGRKAVVSPSEGREKKGPSSSPGISPNGLRPGKP
ncbi:MAG: PAS domain S-box protein [Deltaproteobacteria bacterium]|nr:PAS domain S-box protein [Deltaproteobacteria bacterium]